MKTFIQAEEKNFAIFKFVNELNIEIENYETQIFEMQSEIDKNLAEYIIINERNTVEEQL